MQKILLQILALLLPISTLSAEDSKQWTLKGDTKTLAKVISLGFTEKDMVSDVVADCVHVIEAMLPEILKLECSKPYLEDGKVKIFFSVRFESSLASDSFVTLVELEHKEFVIEETDLDSEYPISVTYSDGRIDITSPNGVCAFYTSEMTESGITLKKI